MGVDRPLVNFEAAATSSEQAELLVARAGRELFSTLGWGVGQRVRRIGDWRLGLSLGSD